MVRILNVAEKNDAAKSLADIMSRGGYRKREGFSKFNKIYEYEYNILNQAASMTMTSVSGHLLNAEFTGTCRKWYGCAPVALFDAPVQKVCPDNYTDIKRTLEREVRGCQALIIWTDCDREGENIGFEVIQVCRQVKPTIRVYRARFSEITFPAVQRAVNSLVDPDQNTSDAVDVRSELDLRIGAAFTRFQTLRLQKVFPSVLAEQLISYGSCQFPTLGFVVERYKQVQAFIPEPFWKIKVSHAAEDGHVDFQWKRGKLFDHITCVVLYQHILESPIARVIDVKSKPKSKWRPVALDTVELEKLASRKLRINAKETMKIAEKLYTQGLISYPRTETNIFPKELNLRQLVEVQCQDHDWGGFASGILERGGPTPRNGSKTDQAHPPIHPTKHTSQLQGYERRVYEFIVRHFLACCSQDAQGQETTVDIDINEERFSASGLMVLARNYLDVYPYDRWSDKVMPTFKSGDEFEPDSIEMNQGETSPPSLLTEADLIALMDKHGIGTDATHAEHIETIKSRLYVGVQPDGKFIPGELGMGLVEGYDAMGYEMSKPHLRAELEADLKLICEGKKNKEDVLKSQIEKYKSVFVQAISQADKIDTALGQYFGEAQPYSQHGQEIQTPDPVMSCPLCNQPMLLKTKKDNKGFFISCSGYPQCRQVIWLPDAVTHAQVSQNTCPDCQGQTKKIHFKFKRGSVPAYITTEYESCIVCDVDLRSFFNLKTTSSNSQAPSKQAHGVNSSMTQVGASAPPQARPSSARGADSSVANYRTPLTELNPAVRPVGVLRDGGREDASDVVCNCGEGAVMLTVRKDGPNKGRDFYVCKKPQDAGDRCKFFLWADARESTTALSQSQPHSNSSYSNSMERTSYSSNDRHDPSSLTDIKCNCQQAAKQLTVQKEGANKGRLFYTCPKPKGQGCNFFQWGDTANGNVSNHRGYHSSAGNRGSTVSAGQDRFAGSASTGKKSRKCGLCRKEGHTKKNCPMNQ